MEWKKSLKTRLGIKKEEEGSPCMDIAEEFQNFGKRMEMVLKSLSDVYILITDNGTIQEIEFKDPSLYQGNITWKGENIENVLSTDVSKAILDILPALRELNRPQTLQFSTRLAGKSRDFEAELFPFIDGNHVLLLQDITDIFTTTDAMFKTEESLRQSEENFKNISEQSLMGISIYQDKEVKYINKVGASILGTTKGEITSSSLDEYGILIDPDDLETMRAEFAKMEDAEPMDSSILLELKVKSKEKGTVYIEQYSNTIFYEGKPGILNVFHDITDKKEAREVLKNEFDRMKEIDDMRKNFISTATHELKTPLVSTCGATKFILDNLKHKLDQETLDLVEIIDRGATRLKKLIENLLDFSRIDTRRFELSLEEADLIEVISNAMQETKYHASTRKHELVFDEPDTLTLNIDGFRIEQLVTNLLSNAIKNTPPGGTIRIEVEQKTDEIKISVIDNGVGLTSDEKQILFEKFGKIPREDSKLDVEIQGSGLGLFISKSIVEAHGGKIWVESEGRNKGSRFIFTIPINTREVA